MARILRFTFACDENERRAIAELAVKLQRAESDAVRYVVLSTNACLAQTNILPLQNSECRQLDPQALSKKKPQ
jgi:hypothetical protein